MYTHVIRSKLGRFWVLGFRTVGREEKGLAHLVVLLARREGGGSVTGAKDLAA